MAADRYSPFDSADYLKSQEDIDAYLEAAEEEGISPEAAAAVAKRAKERWS